MPAGAIELVRPRQRRACELRQIGAALHHGLIEEADAEAVAHQLLARFCRRGADELARRLRRLLVARAPQLRAQVEVKIIVCDRHAYHASLPFSSGMTNLL